MALTGIRSYAAADRDAVVALFRAVAAETATPATAPLIAMYVQAVIERELGRIPQHFAASAGAGFWVAEREALAGMVGVESTPGGEGEARHLAVDRRWRGQGLGRALLGHAEAFCRGLGLASIVVEAGELQQAGMQLLASRGYRLERGPADEPAAGAVPVAGLVRHRFRKAL